MRLDSEPWTCRQCGGDFIGHKPDDLICGPCAAGDDPDDAITKMLDLIARSRDDPEPGEVTGDDQ
jgi:hypothetical protein